MAMKSMKLILLVTVISWLIVDASALSRNEVRTMKRWAPLVYLAKGEKYRPSTVNFFLKNVNLIDGKSGNKRLTSSNLPTCDSGCYLKTRQKMKKATSNNLSFFKGQKLKYATTYAVLRKREETVEIYYWFLYPFNLGKEVCLGAYRKRKKNCFLCKVFSGCAGKYKRFGNHVADWEKIRVILKSNGRPIKIEYYAHGGAHDYVYDGEDFVDEDGKKILFHGTHPVVYSAKGSHGSRASTGRHYYKKLPNTYKIYDDCSAGDRWKTWENLKMVEYNKYRGWSNFIKFVGRWGNKKRGCGPFDIYDTISGQCELNSGPTGPSKMSKDD